MLSEEDMKHPSILEHLMEKPLMEAREEAFQEAFQEGIKIGKRESAITNLIEVLEARFDDSDVALFKPVFDAITDLQLLKKLHRTALCAPTFDDVIQTLLDYHRNNKT